MKKTKTKEQNGQPTLITKDEESAIKEYVTAQSDQNNYVTRQDILQFAQRKTHQMLCDSWLKSFFCRNIDFFHFTTLRPQEDNRINVPTQYIDGHIYNILSHISGMPSEMVFNVDESGSSEWENRKNIKVVTTKSHQGLALHYPTD